MAVFELSAGVWTLYEGSLSVSKLTDLVVTPEHEGSEVIVGHAMPPPALNVIDH